MAAPYKLILKLDDVSGTSFEIDRLEGYEQVCDVFCFTLDVRAESKTLDLSSMLGKVAHVTVDMNGDKRHIYGVIGEAEQGITYSALPTDALSPHKLTPYTFKIYPKFWLLKFTRDHKIFQHKTTLDIIKAVLAENGVTEIEDKTAGAGTDLREFCVQYGESAFDFCSRLMEEAGIFYFFKHTAATHKMVLADMVTIAATPLPDPIQLASYQGIVGQYLLNHIHSFSLQEQVVVKKYAAADYNFKTASSKLHNTIEGVGDGGKVYEYPGLYKASGEGDSIASKRIKELEWMKKTVRGESTVPKFSPMTAFMLAGHPRSAANSLYAIYRVKHTINCYPNREGQQIYINEFEALPETVPFHPPRITPKPRIHSTQTAVVTTPPGEEIHCDTFGRITVKFHWDQLGKSDDTSSCPIRVAQLWAHSAWGGYFTPRKGMEVVVTFLDGDPDRPLITGCVYNSDNMPPYATTPSKNGVKSHTTKGGGGYNEMRFEDLKGSEQIYIQAQKDMDTVVLDGNRTARIEAKKGSGHDTLTLVKGNRKVHLMNGDHTLLIDTGNNKITLSAGDQTTDITGNRKATISANDKLTVTGDLTISVTGAISIKGSSTVSIEAAATMSIKSGASMSIQSGGPMNITGGGPVSIKGPVVKIN